tara:strand:+ start:842 stop:1018 length:177 start_codon:yes stop_codon:yes gene_type:complete
VAVKTIMRGGAVDIAGQREKQIPGSDCAHFIKAAGDSSKAVCGFHIKIPHCGNIPCRD